MNALERKLAELQENTEREDLTWQDEVKAKAEIDSLCRERCGEKPEAGSPDPEPEA